MNVKRSCSIENQANERRIILLKNRIFSIMIMFMVVCGASAYALELDAKAKSSFGFFLDSGRDNSWATEKDLGNDKSMFKTVVGLTLKNDDTKLYWESKFTAAGSTGTIAFAYLYIDTELKVIPGALRLGYQRWGIADAETHPYADGTFYTYCKDKGTGVSYFTTLGDFDIKLTHLGNVFFLDNNGVNEYTTKTFVGLMAKSGSDYSVGVVYNKDTAVANKVDGFSVYGDGTLLLDNLKLVGTYWLDLGENAARASLTPLSSTAKARSDVGLYLTYDLLADLMLYSNYIVDMNKTSFANKVSGGVKYKISNKVATYLHLESLTDKNDANTGSVSVAFETSI